MSRRVYLASILHYELKIQIFVQILRGIVAFKSSKNQIQTYNTIIPILFFVQHKTYFIIGVLNHFLII